MNLFLQPAQGDFDVAAIKARLESMSDVFLDPLGTGRYILCGTPVAVETYRRARLADPSRFPYVCLLDVTPEQVTVAQEYGDADQLRSAREFVRWILQRFACRIEDDYATDLTERYRQEGIDIFYPKGL